MLDLGRNRLREQSADLGFHGNTSELDLEVGDPGESDIPSQSFTTDEEVHMSWNKTAHETYKRIGDRFETDLTDEEWGADQAASSTAVADGSPGARPISARCSTRFSTCRARGASGGRFRRVFHRLRQSGTTTTHGGTAVCSRPCWTRCAGMRGNWQDAPEGRRRRANRQPGRRRPPRTAARPAAMPARRSGAGNATSRSTSNVARNISGSTPRGTSAN